MAIRTLNPVVPNVKRPFRIEDLQEIWDGLNNAVASDSIDTQGNPILIFVSGFAENMQSEILSAGVVAYGGKLYYYDPEYSALRFGDTFYLETIQSEDTRIFEDGLSRPFYLDNQVVEESDVTSPDAINLGVITAERVRNASATRIGDNDIVNSMLADDSVAERNLQNESVTNRTVADDAINNRTLAVPVKSYTLAGYTNPYAVQLTFSDDARNVSKSITDFINPLSDEDPNPPVFLTGLVTVANGISIYLDTVLPNANYPNRVSIVFENSVKAALTLNVRNPLDGSESFAVHAATAATDYGKGLGVVTFVKYRGSNGLYMYIPE